ncbi:hypothetical protein Sarmat_01186 [Rickettsiales endosymbiont of Paramecium tredecaurelia]|nr:hypothetical protein [Candidatus Sarmatiella mevalonica]
MSTNTRKYQIIIFLLCINSSLLQIIKTLRTSHAKHLTNLFSIIFVKAN